MWICGVSLSTNGRKMLVRLGLGEGEVCRSLLVRGEVEVGLCRCGLGRGVGRFAGEVGNKKVGSKKVGMEIGEVYEMVRQWCR